MDDEQFVTIVQTHKIPLSQFDGSSLQYIDQQTPDLCMFAVKQNGMNLQYVDEQTEEICLEAVKQNGLALVYVLNPTADIYLAAYYQNPTTIRLYAE